MTISAEQWATELHDGATYGGLSYKEGHLAQVVWKLRDLGYGMDGAMIDAGWLHDSVEDVARTYDAKMLLLEEIRQRHGDRTGDLVWAVTGIGKNRKERNAAAYAKIVTTQDAPILKFADRLINVQNSAEGSSHKAMYRKEHPSFWQVIGPFVPIEWEAMMVAALGA